MAFNRRFPRNERIKSIVCSCKGIAKLTSRRNYPFGRKSDSITAWFYKCKSCGNITFLNN